jgi:hypothetical protein
MEPGLYAGAYDGGVESTASPEGPAGRAFRRAGLVLLLLASMLPYHGCRQYPGGRPREHFSPEYTGLNGAAILEGALRSAVLQQSGFRVEDALFACDGKSDDFIGPFVFLILPFWALALLLVRGGRPWRRWAVGAFLWLVIGAAFAAAALAGEWDLDLSKGPPGFGITGPPLLLPFAAGLLLLRPRARRGFTDVEATVSSQAVLALGLCLSWPAIQGMVWTFQDGHPVGDVVAALLANYRAGFWCALLALSLVAAPLYFSEESLRRLYDRCRPWRSRSSTPTPTSTSTGSTPTGTPSSTAPAPPGSSPS